MLLFDHVKDNSASWKWNFTKLIRHVSKLPVAKDKHTPAMTTYSATFGDRVSLPTLDKFWFWPSARLLVDCCTILELINRPFIANLYVVLGAQRVCLFLLVTVAGQLPDSRHRHHRAGTRSWCRESRCICKSVGHLKTKNTWLISKSLTEIIPWLSHAPPFWQGNWSHGSLAK